MSNLEKDYRAKAAECLERARNSGDHELKHLYQGVAVQWLVLAEKQADIDKLLASDR